MSGRISIPDGGCQYPHHFSLHLFFAAACFYGTLAFSAASDWTGGSANWSSNTVPGWNGTGVPDAPGAIADFGAGANVNGTSVVDIGGVTVGTISFSAG